MAIQVTAPTRIDLAGGTLDIWPIYLMLQDPVTINVAINVYATVTLKERKDKKINIISKDGREEISALSINELDGSDVLPLPVSVVKYFAPKNGFDLEIHSRSPRGGGIGGSSSLLIALITAFSLFCRRKFSSEDLITLARDIESSVLKVPAGVQDYYPAATGGVSAIHLLAGGCKVEKIPVPLKELGRSIVLCYTGQPRNSGVNNWDITKKFIDGDQPTRKLLQKIAKISNSLHEALRNKDYDEVGGLIAREWECRLELAPQITTPLIDRILEAGKGAGGVGGKVCGAGGGGCLFLYCKPGKKDVVEKAVSAAGGEIIPFEVSDSGVKIKNAR